MEGEHEGKDGGESPKLRRGGGDVHTDLELVKLTEHRSGSLWDRVFLSSGTTFRTSLDLLTDTEPPGTRCGRWSRVGV